MMVESVKETEGKRGQVGLPAGSVVWHETRDKEEKRKGVA